jgi:hypothetical protein
LSSDHLLSGVRAEYKKAGAESTVLKRDVAGLRSWVLAIGCQLSVLSEKRRDLMLDTGYWELIFAVTLVAGLRRTLRIPGRLR